MMRPGDPNERFNNGRLSRYLSHADASSSLVAVTVTHANFTPPLVRNS